MNRLPGEQHLVDAESEIAARRYAKDALNKGLRVEAGTLLGIGPEICVRWREAGAWASSEAAPCLAD